MLKIDLILLSVFLFGTQSATASNAQPRCVATPVRLVLGFIDGPNVRCKVNIEDWKTPYIEWSGKTFSEPMTAGCEEIAAELLAKSRRLGGIAGDLKECLVDSTTPIRKTCNLLEGCMQTGGEAIVLKTFSLDFGNGQIFQATPRIAP